MAKFYYGGQAVMEGVMMRGKRSAAVAVRKPEGEIYLYEEGLNPGLYQNRFLRLPFLRGILLLWEMLVLGTRMMTLAANIVAGPSSDAIAHSTDDDRTTATQSSEARLSRQEVSASSAQEESPKPPAIGGVVLGLTILISLAFAIVIFFITPLFLAGLLHGQLGEGWLNVLVEGVIRLLLLLGYLGLIGRIPDIQRVFGYHGAEHKAINTMESGEPLDVAHVRQASRVHTRCGTGFLLLVMVVSIVVFALVGSPALPIKILSRILLVPLVAGLSYELMRLGAANYRYRVVRWLLAPGLALQGLTTREPDDTMIECAIASLKRVIQRDEATAAYVSGDEEALPPLVFVK